MVELIILMALLGGQAAAAPPGNGQGPPTPEARPSSLCDDARVLLATATTAAASEICLGEQAQHAANAAPPGSSDRATGFRTAAAHVRQGATLTVNAAIKARALDVLAVLFDREHFNEPGAEEATLRERIALTPDDLTPVFSLARLQEQGGFIDLAEDTLVGARRRQPDALEPYHRLAQFYARRAGALQSAEARLPRPAEEPGKPDEHGVYRVGGSLEPPRREGTPRYPDNAKAADVGGVVVVEIVVGPDGSIAESRVVRSIPLLDQAALEAVKTWRYDPTVVDGTPVPVRMNVTINFAPPR